MVKAASVELDNVRVEVWKVYRERIVGTSWPVEKAGFKIMTLEG